MGGEGCSRTHALKSIRVAYDAIIRNNLMMRALVFDAESDNKIQIRHDDEVDDLDPDDVWNGELY